MVDDVTTEDRPRTSSPWPLLVAVGLPVAEVGVLFGVAPLAVGGLVLFSASVVGLLRESGYARSRSRPTAAVGLSVGLVGGVLLAGTGAVTRARYLLGVGALVAAAGGVLWLAETGRL